MLSSQSHFKNTLWAGESPHSSIFIGLSEQKLSLPQNPSWCITIRYSSLVKEYIYPDVHACRPFLSMGRSCLTKKVRGECDFILCWLTFIQANLQRDLFINVISFLIISLYLHNQGILTCKQGFPSTCQTHKCLHCSSAF